MQKQVARLENARIVGEQAEDDPDQKTFQVMPPVACREQRVMQPSDDFGGFDVGRILIPESASLYADDETELFDLGRQVGQREGALSSFVAIVKMEGLEVAD